MTESIKIENKLVELAMGDRVRARQRVEKNVKTPISRKAIGVVGDVHETHGGKTLVTVVFAKQNEAPSLWPEELVKLPPHKSKADAVKSPPRLPDDIKE